MSDSHASNVSSLAVVLYFTGKRRRRLEVFSWFCFMGKKEKTLNPLTPLLSAEAFMPGFHF